MPATDLARWGVTRLASQGALDTLGVAVWSAIRPTSRSFCVTNGKGWTDEAARTGALFEAIECACAEEVERHVVAEASAEELARQGRQVIEFARFAASRHPRPSPSLRRRWVRGKEMGSGRAIYAPVEMVCLDFRVRAAGTRDTFVTTSVGLAAHVERSHAIEAALLECIENDALALAVGLRRREKFLRLDPRTLGTPELCGLLRRIAAVGVDLGLFDLTSDVGLPTVLCLLSERGAGGPGLRVHGGVACRGNEASAASAAILEAAQSRVTDIAGARDDISPEEFCRFSLLAREPASLRPVARSGLSDHPSVDAICEALRCAKGVGTPVLFDLAPQGVGVHCVRALVPGLELADDGCRPRRLDRFRLNALIRSLT